jgi:hypothetical protein
MSLDLPYDQSLDLDIDDTHYANGTAILQFTEDNDDNALAAVTVYADPNQTQAIVSKSNLAINSVPPPGLAGSYYFQFNLSASNPNKSSRDNAGYIPGTYTFSFVPSSRLPLSGTISDPHKHITGDDSEWTADVPHPEEAETTGAASAGR